MIVTYHEMRFGPNSVILQYTYIMMMITYRWLQIKINPKQSNNNIHQII